MGLPSVMQANAASVHDTLGHREANLSAVLHGAGDMRMETRTIPSLASDEILIRVRATGLCGSDLHYFSHGRNGDFSLEHPMCLGHESAGQIVAVGQDVPIHHPTLAIGAHVAIEPGQNCSACELCLTGHYNLCSSLRFASSAKTKPHLDGTLQRFFAWPARLCHLLPEHLPLRTAALIEPLAVVLQALSRSHLESGQSVLVIGAGAVGLLTCLTAKAFGASFVAAADIDKGRLQFGEANGWIDKTYCIPRTTSGAEGSSGTSRAEQDKHDIAAAKLLADRIRSSVGTSRSATASAVSELGFDAVFECTGVPSCIQVSIFAAKTGGRVVLIGMGHPIVTMPLGQAALREVDILGVFRYANMFPKAIRLLGSGVIPSLQKGGAELGSSDEDVHTGTEKLTDTREAMCNQMAGVECLISHAIPLEQAVEAFYTLKSGQSKDGRDVVKVLIVDD